MITAEKLKVYEAWGGDPDMWARAARKRDRDILSSEDWRLIEKLIREVTLVERNLAADDYARQIEVNLKAGTADASVAARIRVLAAGPVRAKRWWRFW
jgi:hypothetical protein